MNFYTFLPNRPDPVNPKSANPVINRFNNELAALPVVAIISAFMPAGAYAHGDAEALEEIVITSTRNQRSFSREDDLRIGLEAYYYGAQTLNDGDKSRDYWIFGLMAEKIFSERFSVFLNFENFTDKRQTRYESIYSGTAVNPVFNDIYAPLDGFVINCGVKLGF